MFSWLYFFISYPRNKRENTEDIIFVKPEDGNVKPQYIDIYGRKLSKSNIFLYENILSK